MSKAFRGQSDRLPESIRFRIATDADLPFLFTLYASTREDELAADDAAVVRETLSEVSTAAADAREAVRDVRAAVEPIRTGKSSMSAVLLDEKLYDDLEEMVHHLKKRPWKLFWKE